MILGQDCPELGAIQAQNLQEVWGALSAGKDPLSPALAFKGDPGIGNEDGLLLMQAEDMWLLAVADGHFGHQSSHALLRGLAGLTRIPRRLGELALALSAGDWLADTVGGAALLVACCQRIEGKVFGLSFGDCSLVVVGPEGASLVNQPESRYLGGGFPINIDLAIPFAVQLKAKEFLLAYTDGINECCYRQPVNSVNLQDVQRLYGQYKQEPQEFTQQLMHLALQGVRGHAGGQDNIALITLPYTAAS